MWSYVAAADWHRIGQDLPVLGRAGSRHDDLGSRVVTAHVVQICMHLGFLLQRRWPPYSKWMGAMFTVSAGASSVAAALQAAMASENWQDRQAAVAQALLALHEMQRAAGLPTAKQALEPFHNRPFLAVRPSVTDLLLKEVTDPLVRQMPRGVGSVEQWVDNVDVLIDAGQRVVAAQVWRALLSAGL